MSRKTVSDPDGDPNIVTFSCYKRRNILDDDRAKRIVISVLASELVKKGGLCAGFVIMPNHVHSLLWFEKSNCLSGFLKSWKQRSSYNIKNMLESVSLSYVPREEPVWQARYFNFPIYSYEKLNEKLNYMHINPVKAGLVENPEDWPSARLVGTTWDGRLACLFTK